MRNGLLNLLPLLVITGTAVTLIIRRVNRRNLATAKPQINPGSSEDAWVAPPEIVERAVPRRVLFSSTFKATIGMLCLVELIMLGSALMQYRVLGANGNTYRRLQTEGVPAQGKILNISEHHTRRSRYTLATYSFQIDGREYRRVATVDSYNALSLRIGQEAAVTFLPTDPNVSRLSVERIPQAPFFALIPAFSIGILIAFFMIAPVFRQRLILSEGVAVAGKVTRCTPVKGGYRVAYTFTDDAGVPREGKSSYRTALIPGSVVTVIYLPRDSSRSTLYPSPNFQVT